MNGHDGNGNGMPKLEPIWLALGIVVWAIASAMAAPMRARFIKALETIIKEHEDRRRIVAFDRRSLGKREVSRIIRVAIVFLRRLLEGLGDTHGRGT